MSQRLGINLLVYKEELDNKREQSDILKEIKECGITCAEIRREYIADQNEIQKIRKAGKKYQMELYYSVPEKIMEGEEPNKELTSYLEEAKWMQVKNVKFNIGSLYKITKSGADKLKEILNKYEMMVTVENDQTAENGTLDCVVKALEMIEKYELPIGYTMDLGNWYWQKEEPEKAFEQLKENIKILHLKNISFQDGKPGTVMLEEGKIPWRKMAAELKKDVDIFLEYPIPKPEIADQIKRVQEIL